jgi:steroid delta-isomerase-like uncharacterized protein
MEKTDAVAKFYGAWNQRDADALARTFVDDGTFTDPLCRSAVSGDALRAHVAAVAAALPELHFSVTRTLSAADHAAVAWSLKAVCKGALDRELTADGMPFVLEGIDLFQIAEGGIRSVRRFFERRDLVEQLGMQSFVEPIEVGTMTFGYSLRDWVSKAKPALLGMTWIQARDEDDKTKIRGFARRIIKGFHDVPGFIGVVTGFVGLHGFTLTAWESEEALRGGVHGPEHVEAMRGFHQGTSAGVFTSVWQPLRLNRVWLHCTHCGTANDGYPAGRMCQHCGTPLADPPPYI